MPATTRIAAVRLNPVFRPRARKCLNLNCPSYSIQSKAGRLLVEPDQRTSASETRELPKPADQFIHKLAIRSRRVRSGLRGRIHGSSYDNLRR
jgi:hypothetical protein